MPEIRNHLCLVALGPNREQLAADLVHAIARRGCNIIECRVTPLGTYFSAAILLTGNWSAMARMESALPALADDLQLKIHYTHGRPGDEAPDFRPYSAEVIAPQQPRLLSKLLDFFAAQNTRVVEISTQEYDSSFTGATMCSTHMALHVPLTQHPQALRDAFMDLCDELHADGLLDPIKS
ncbi:MAG TPA: ACT domain-containing protein [Salinisphaeraceae bacterium]|nr:ACT domain-containing protein [Salinisphaeraceae bacterium]